MQLYNLKLLPLTLAILALVSAWTAGPASAADRVALIIGVDKYSKLPDGAQLGGAVRDATNMANALRSIDPPFDVTLLTDAKHRETEQAFDSFLDKAKGAKCAMLYYAGHGIEYFGKNYLLVSDTEIPEVSEDVSRMQRRLGNEALSMQMLLDDLELTSAMVKLLVLDCCRDNPLAMDTGATTRSLVGEQKGLAQATPPSGTLISYSADAGQKANDGLFTDILVHEIKNSGLPILKVFASTREKVLSISKQWAAEDKKSGLPPEARRVVHEPAEYSKLNLAGTDFTFTRTTRNTDPLPMPKPVNENKHPMEKPKPPPRYPSDSKLIGKSPGEVREIGGIPMVWCPAGEFLMGSSKSEAYRGEDESQHKVYLSYGFWIAKTECTQAQWETVTGSNPSQWKYPDHPVESVSWEDCQRWVEQLNQENSLPYGWKWALPTEAQWEYACRAGTESPYATGATLSKEQAAYGDTSGTTRKPGLYAANGWGIQDMHGNVMEWCADWYGENYYLDGQTDPKGPPKGTYRIFRGGSVKTAANFCRSAHRSRFAPDFKNPMLGFRPAVVVSSP